ncbi:nitroreductase family deazaflavin-dependent oxidoreductase [Solirubrobacter sp. CPCC 204708]|uniref:Nitroreductase family deazaflavin-dependent oxidoreductase n=1 Tax=Solirubrobacter deserti TaxID=2282478 RepID=A0ABT4REX9_9ACTN|nr:nitroreductase/quinone reductase family protein [Solirubrobacter deserti]MBE2318629.1 nitroreductase family deazaflavin-dependent oxidoreductase [Solirubrobacter deserti]MDA0137087.1 nitroreductase family deazaflavin-dependent oxidoreductase [Solirubrobacter deserti]
MPPLVHLLGTGRAVDNRPGGVRAVKRRLARPVTNRVVNPLVRPLVERGLLDPGWALLETRGRRSGKPRVVPVGNGLRDGVFWIITEHGYHADYVRNILAEPRVRVKVGGRWRDGRALVLPEEDPYARMRALKRPINDSLLLTVGTEQLVVRVDLDD